MPDFNASNNSDGPISIAINNVINASVIAETTRGYLGASAIGHECMRHIQFDWMVNPEHPGPSDRRGHPASGEKSSLNARLATRPAKRRRTRLVQP